MNGILRQARDLLFPRVRCLGCDEPREIDPGEPLCGECLAALRGLELGNNVCSHCLCFLPRHGPCAYCGEGHMAGLVGAWAPYRYHSVSQRLVVQLKFSSVFQAADLLVEGMLDNMPSSGFDALVPVPLHKSRRRQRGFNQAELLARRVGEVSGMPVLIALERHKRTKRQSGLVHKKRHDNVKGCFRTILPVKGMRLLLVDDVRTSGSTARECASMLLGAGAACVGLLTATVAAGYSPSNPSVTTV